MAARRGDDGQSLHGNMSECPSVLRVSLSTSRWYGAFRSKARKQGAFSRVERTVDMVGPGGRWRHGFPL
jgi:hypothetical protein